MMKNGPRITEMDRLVHEGRYVYALDEYLNLSRENPREALAIDDREGLLSLCLDEIPSVYLREFGLHGHLGKDLALGYLLDMPLETLEKEISALKVARKDSVLSELASQSPVFDHSPELRFSTNVVPIGNGSEYSEEHDAVSEGELLRLLAEVPTDEWVPTERPHP